MRGVLSITILISYCGIEIGNNESVELYGILIPYESLIVAMIVISNVHMTLTVSVILNINTILTVSIILNVSVVLTKNAGL